MEVGNFFMTKIMTVDAEKLLIIKQKLARQRAQQFSTNLNSRRERNVQK